MMKLLSIIDLNQLLATQETADRLLMSMWADFLRPSKKITKSCVQKEHIWGIPRKKELS